MELPEQRIRVVAATPIQAGDRRLLPSVLVNTVHVRRPGAGLAQFVRLRPVSVVVEHGQDAEWYEIPNATVNALSSMAAMALGVAVVSTVLIVVSAFLRRR